MKTLLFPTYVSLQNRSIARHPEPLGKLRFGPKGKGPHIRPAITIPPKTSKVSHTTLGKLRFGPKGEEPHFRPAISICPKHFQGFRVVSMGKLRFGPKGEDLISARQSQFHQKLQRSPVQQLFNHIKQ